MKNPQPATGRIDETSRARKALREWILIGELPPGNSLSQVELARRLGVSRGPLREAMRSLQHEGLIMHEHNQRPRVAAVSARDVDHLYAMRIAIESLAVAISVPLLTAADLIKLEDLLSEMDALAHAGDIEAWEKPHGEFHAMLVRPAGERFDHDCGRLSDHARRYRRMYIASDRHLWTTGVSEHQAIASGARSRDSDAAALATADHLARTAIVVLASIDPGYDAAAVRRALRDRRQVSREMC